MSFRVRVLSLVAAVAVAAVAATAYLTYVQANRQVTRQVAADERTTGDVLRELHQYAEQHGSWDGVGDNVHAIADRIHQRIRLVTDDGELIVDSAGSNGAAAPVTVPPIVLDARPTLELPAGAPAPDVATLEAIASYRGGVRTATCLRQQGLEVDWQIGPYGVPLYAATEAARRVNAVLVAQCQKAQRARDETDGDRAAVKACRGDPANRETTPVIDCLQRVFTARTAGVAPGVLRLYLVSEEGAPAPIQPGPVIAAAALVTVVALAGTALISRRVLRPIADVTDASASLGQGDLARRVPVRGRDELARLAQSFNRMADSVQSSEERQRRLVADVAHELRTPLANLRGYLEAIKDGVLAGDPKLFANLHREAVLQQRIVDDLQDLALAEAGALAYHHTVVDLAELLETCRTAHQPAAGTAGVTLTVRANGPTEVSADPDRLRQVVGNLITNALRATPPGGSVTLMADREVGGAARVSVTDTGTGIAATDLPYIFDRFWRADAARGRGTGGSGLGLAIARQIVIDHGGTLTAESQPGSGTTMTIRLPDSRQD
jgi:two-component system, OmpR family, sensor histidine kinase BaeS